MRVQGNSLAQLTEVDDLQPTYDFLICENVLMDLFLLASGARIYSQWNSKLKNVRKLLRLPSDYVQQTP